MGDLAMPELSMKEPIEVPGSIQVVVVRIGDGPPDLAVEARNRHPARAFEILRLGSLIPK